MQTQTLHQEGAEHNAGRLPLLLQFLLSLSDASSSTWQQKAQKKNGSETFFKKTKGPICLIVLVKRQLNLSFQTWQGVTGFPERRRKGVVPYLLPPLQLTKDALEALVHVVELERSKWDCCVSPQAFTFLILLLMETASAAWADYKNQIQKPLTGRKRLFLKKRLRNKSVQVCVRSRMEWRSWPSEVSSPPGRIRSRRPCPPRLCPSAASPPTRKLSPGSEPHEEKHTVILTLFFFYLAGTSKRKESDKEG